MGQSARIMVQMDQHGPAVGVSYGGLCGTLSNREHAHAPHVDKCLRHVPCRYPVLYNGAASPGCKRMSMTPVRNRVVLSLLLSVAAVHGGMFFASRGEPGGNQPAPLKTPNTQPYAVADYYSDSTCATGIGSTKLTVHECGQIDFSYLTIGSCMDGLVNYTEWSCAKCTGCSPVGPIDTLKKVGACVPFGTGGLHMIWSCVS